MVLFKGNEHYPLGNATLQIVNNKLQVNNIGNSGIDGVLVKSNFANRLDVKYTPFTVTGNEVVKVATKYTNSEGKIVTNSEKFYWRDSSTNELNIGYNASLLPPNYFVVGYTNGTESFRIPFNNPHYNPVPFPDPNPNPNPDPGPGLVFAIIGVVIGVATVSLMAYDIFSDDVETEIEIETQQGTKLKTTRTRTDPPISNIKVNGVTYTADIFGVEFQEKTPISVDVSQTNLMMEITMQNKSNFEIIDEIGS